MRVYLCVCVFISNHFCIFAQKNVTKEGKQKI